MKPKRIIVCDIDEARLDFVRRHYPEVLTTMPDQLPAFVLANSDHGGADVVLEVAGSGDTFRMPGNAPAPTPSSPSWPCTTARKACRCPICTARI